MMAQWIASERPLNPMESQDCIEALSGTARQLPQGIISTLFAYCSDLQKSFLIQFI
jgi:hypothetical protein